MIDTRTALERSVIVHPADDTPRLVFADWLDEQPRVTCGTCGGKGSVFPGRMLPVGGFDCACPTCSGSGVVYPDRDRASFIRCQVELARMSGSDPGCPRRPPRAELVRRLAEIGKGPDEDEPCHACWPGRDALRARERELFCRSTPDWWGIGPVLITAPDTLFLVVADGSHRYKVVRGFPEELHCTLAAFVGRECPVCDGNRWFVEGGRIGGCARCNATGRLPGLAATVASRVPVRAVYFSDREPSAMSLEPFSWWFSDDDPGILPRCLADDPAALVTMNYYPSRDAALADASSRAVRLARRLAGLGT